MPEILEMLGKSTVKYEGVLFHFRFMSSDRLAKIIKLILSKFQTCLGSKIIVESFSCKASTLFS